MPAPLATRSKLAPDLVSRSRMMKSGPSPKGVILAELLGRSSFAGLTCHADMNHFLGVHVDDEEREHRSEPDVVDLQKIANRDGMMAKERLPALPISRRSN